MAEIVNLPALGESVTEGTITRWLKNVGDTVAVDEPIVEVSTDKVDTEIPSPIAGVIEEIFAQEDDVVPVGSPLVRIGDGSGAAAPAAAPVAAEPAAAPVVTAEPVAATPVVAEPVVAAPVVAAPVVSAPVASAPVVSAPSMSAPAAAPVVSRAGAPYVTPIVRKFANDLGVNLATVVGTGVGGRIRREDVQAAAHAGGASTATPSAAIAASTILPVSALRGTRVPMTRLRKVVAERAVASMVSTAQLTTVVEVDVTAVARLRDVIKADFQTKTGNKLTFLPFFAKATVEALQAFPIINCTVEGDEIVYPATENISIAVDTERGLLTPVVKNAGGKSVAQFAAEIADLAARTRDNKLSPDELAGGTFTLTNTGSRGALFDTPVVFLPQSAILGLGAVVKRPVVVATEDGQESIAIRSMVYLALSYDHRIIDGADAARFLSTVKARLEEGVFTAQDLGY